MKTAILANLDNYANRLTVVNDKIEEICRKMRATLDETSLVKSEIAETCRKLEHIRV